RAATFDADQIGREPLDDVYEHLRVERQLALVRPLGAGGGAAQAVTEVALIERRDGLYSGLCLVNFAERHGRARNFDGGEPRRERVAAATRYKEHQAVDFVAAPPQPVEPDQPRAERRVNVVL